MRILGWARTLLLIPDSLTGHQATRRKGIDVKPLSCLPLYASLRLLWAAGGGSVVVVLRVAMRCWCW